MDNMKDIKPLNGNIFLLPIKETKQVGGIDLTAKLDEDDRYRKGEVIYSCDTTPVVPGDILLYDKNNGFGFQHGDHFYTVLHIGNIKGIINER